MAENNYEKQIQELNEKLKELRDFSQQHDIDLTQEIQKLEDKVHALSKEMNENLTVWQQVQLARHQERPTTLDYISHIFNDFIELHGDRLFADDPAIVGGIGFLNDTPVTIIGHQKGKNTKENVYRRFGMPQPEGYRKALRLMQEANKFNRPIITFINTAGAFPGKEAEERGQSEAIARNLREMAGFKVPIISIVIGEGGSGGALALGVGNRIFLLENSFYSVISPEGAAALLWKDASKAQQAAETMKITADDLLELKIIDGIIPEPEGGAHKNIEQQAASIKQFIETTLSDFSSLTNEDIIEQRYQKFRHIGVFEK